LIDHYHNMGHPALDIPPRETSKSLPFRTRQGQRTPPVKYRPIEGPTAKGSTTKGTHRAGEEKETNETRGQQDKEIELHLPMAPSPYQLPLL
jgi:hypothetical protein